jgi:hypothetical protein
VICSKFGIGRSRGFQSAELKNDLSHYFLTSPLQHCIALPYLHLIKILLYLETNRRLGSLQLKQTV